MKRVISAVLAVAVILTAGCLSACEEKKEYPVTLGKVTVAQEPENIVVLNKNLADIVLTLGYEEKLASRGDEVNQKGMKVVPEVGDSQSPSVKAILNTKSELVLADNTLDPMVSDKLEKKGVTVFRFDEANTPKQVKGLYKKLGRILGGEISGTENAAKTYKELSSTLKSIGEASASDNTMIRTVAYLYIDNGVLKTFNKGSWGDTMLGLTGAMNVFKNAETEVVDNDSLSLSNPEFLIFADMDTYEYLMSGKIAKKLNALNNKPNRFIIPYDEITMQGDTSLDVLQKMIKKMFPQEFDL